MVELYESHAAFGQPSREQAICRKRSGVSGIGAVGVEYMCRLIRKIYHFRNAGLHAECHFVVGYSRCDLIVGCADKLMLMELTEPIEHLAAVGG